MDEVKTILEFELKSKDTDIPVNGKQALDHLLKADCFEFLDMEK